jgi:hypothetical protein
MAEFLLELYVPRTDGAALAREAERARRAAAAATRSGAQVRYVRSFLVPEDETCFVVFEAATADDVRSAALLAGLRFEHVAELFGDSC